jgi:hypothetical protein
MQDRETKLQRLAQLIAEQREIDLLRIFKINPELAKSNAVTRIVPGKKYTKIDVGPSCNWSGKYMVDEDGNIYGIKAYGVIHRGHRYGTLDTIDDWYWGGYTATPRKKGAA